MTRLDPNFRDLLVCLNSANAKYLVLGGYAVNFYRYHRNTADFDVWTAIDGENAERVSDALCAFGFTRDSVPPSKFDKKGPIHAFGRKPWRIDLLTAPSGVEFAECYARRIEAEIEGVQIPWISLKDLLINKNASGRTKDSADLENLDALAKHKKKKLTPGKKRKPRK
jgi:hypothetical protein